MLECINDVTRKCKFLQDHSGIEEPLTSEEEFFCAVVLKFVRRGKPNQVFLLAKSQDIKYLSAMWQCNSALNPCDKVLLEYNCSTRTILVIYDVLRMCDKQTSKSTKKPVLGFSMYVEQVKVVERLIEVNLK